MNFQHPAIVVGDDEIRGGVRRRVQQRADIQRITTDAPKALLLTLGYTW